MRLVNVPRGHAGHSRKLAAFTKHGAHVIAASIRGLNAGSCEHIGEVVLVSSLPWAV
jgi:hypothetical protein